MLPTSKLSSDAQNVKKGQLFVTSVVRLKTDHIKASHITDHIKDLFVMPTKAITHDTATKSLKASKFEHVFSLFHWVAQGICTRVSIILEAD